MPGIQIGTFCGACERAARIPELALHGDRDDRLTFTAAPISPSVAPGRITLMAVSSDLRVTSNRRLAFGVTSAPTGTMMAESP